MESRVQKAIENHSKGYNCAQAIVCTYCDLFGMNEEDAFKLSEAFGAGMGNMNGPCGAVSGLYMLAGLKKSSGSIENGMTKSQTYKDVNQLGDEFVEMNKTLICRELKGLDGTGMKRTCSGCIEDAAKLVEKYLIDK